MTNRKKLLEQMARAIRLAHNKYIGLHEPRPKVLGVDRMLARAALRVFEKSRPTSENKLFEELLDAARGVKAEGTKAENKTPRLSHWNRLSRLRGAVFAIDAARKQSTTALTEIVNRRRKDRERKNAARRREGKRA